MQANLQDRGEWLCVKCQLLNQVGAGVPVCKGCGRLHPEIDLAWGMQAQLASFAIRQGEGVRYDA